MLPSFVSNFFWGVTPSIEQESLSAREANDENQTATEVEHTAQEDGDWLLITSSKKLAGSSSGSSPCLGCDVDSVCSEESWIITPAAMFSESGISNFETFHSMEDLLIEHPAMSVYQPNHSEDNDEPKSSDETKSQVENENERNRLERQALVLMRNRQRQEVATYLQVQHADEGWSSRSSYLPSSKPPRLTRGALKRQNINLFKGKHVSKAVKASRKAGRRRT